MCSWYQINHFILENFGNLSLVFLKIYFIIQMWYTKILNELKQMKQTYLLKLYYEWIYSLKYDIWVWGPSTYLHISRGINITDILFFKCITTIIQYFFLKRIFLYCFRVVFVVYISVSSRCQMFDAMQCLSCNSHIRENKMTQLYRIIGLYRKVRRKNPWKWIRFN